MPTGLNVLIVLTSHAAMGNTGEPTGFWLEEFTTPYYVFADAKAKVFDIAIQSGAMLAVILVYWQRLRDTVAGLGSSAQARAFVAAHGVATGAAVFGERFTAAGNEGGVFIGIDLLLVQYTVSVR